MSKPRPATAGLIFRRLPLLPLLILLTACQGAYYATMEQLGYEKRDLMMEATREARDAQAAAGEHFADALEEFRGMVELRDDNYQEMYHRLSWEYHRSKDRANDASKRIDEVERVSQDLFEEWGNELEGFSSEERRKASAKLLKQARARTSQMLVAMHRAEDSMAPVLQSLKDQVEFIERNLDANAFSSRNDELLALERETAAVESEVQRAIIEADAFLRAMR